MINEEHEIKILAIESSCDETAAAVVCLLYTSDAADEL